MTSTHVLTSLFGEIALLLWGIHMVSSSVQRALGGNLRHVLAIGLRNRGRAFLAGFAVTGLLQSSTAVALMVTSFSGGGTVDLVPALAAMLGANVGTTLIVQAASFDISLIYPVLLFVGVTIFQRAQRSVLRDMGSALVGLGLILLALQLLTLTMRPIEASQGLRTLLQAIGQDPLLNILLAAALSWAAHSSVAAMLFIMSLAGADVIPTDAALAMVLGANLGSAVNPLIAGFGGDPAKLRVPVGNFVNRLLGCAFAVPLIPYATAALSALGQEPNHMAANFHFIFNLLLALLFIGPLPWLAAVLRRFLPDTVGASDPGIPIYLDQAALSTPTVAVVNASREVLRMADVVASMLRGSREAFHHDDHEKIAAIIRTDDVVDSLYSAIQHYIGAISHDALNEDEGRRIAEILGLAINLEHIGDIVDQNLMELAAKRINNQLKLPPDALAAVDDMHGRLLDHLQLALAVFMSGDADAARRLVGEKEQFREIERAATRTHFMHMRTGRSDEIETSSLQLDITRDLKRIEAHIAATAYSLLEDSGQLRTSRLVS